MDALKGDPRWSEAFPWLARTGQDGKIRRLLEEAEAVHRNSAIRLRELGLADLARQAERFAGWTRFDLDEPVLARRLYAVTSDLREVPETGSLLTKILEGALDLAGASRGNIQLLDPATGSLRIAAQHGFSAEFLHHFAVVDDDGSACGRAARQRAQTVIGDVGRDASFASHLDVAASSGFRAVQSTPLIDRTERLLGVVSTHYPDPYTPSARDLAILERYGYLAGQLLADRLGWGGSGLRSPAGRAGQPSSRRG